MKNAVLMDDERRRMAEFIRQDRRLNFGDILECEECGFIGVSMPPDAAALADFYKAYYANSTYEKKQNSKLKRASRRLQRLKNYVSGERFLDVGCNLGFAVEAAGLSGYSATGIDIDGDAVCQARQRFPARVFSNTTVRDLAAQGCKFDLVYCTEVLEHLADFRGFVHSLGQVVAKKGVLFLTTPDAGHFRRPRNLMTWAEVKPPEHLSWFSKPHLRELFENEGLRVKFRFNWKPGVRMIAIRD